MHTTLETHIGSIPCFVSQGIHPIVLLIFPAVFGIDSDIEDLCEHYARLGFTTIAVDPFWDSHPGPLPHTVDGVRAAL